MAQRRRKLDSGKPGDHDEHYIFEAPSTNQLEALLRKMHQYLDGALGGERDGEEDAD